METGTGTRTVRQLARLAGISIRTLHFYDQIGLLKPSARSEAGYRLYGEADLLRLQQVLFFRELDFPLADIQAILDRPGFDQVEALRAHRRMLGERAERMARLLHTVDRTIANLTGEDKMPLTDDEIYAGFSAREREELKGYEAEAAERWGEMAAESQRRVRQLSRAQWQAIKDEGAAVTNRMAELMGTPVGAPEVQAAIARQHAWIENFYPCSAEMFRGLGQMYVDDPRFAANYEKVRPGLAVFMRDAMAYYAGHTLAG
jgi:MerR family transcriptional regulator, thiopeptide resistance regulator